MSEQSISTIKKDEEFARKKLGDKGEDFPWVLTLNAGTDGEYTMCFRTLEDAAEALKSWHGKE